MNTTNKFILNGVILLILSLTLISCERTAVQPLIPVTVQFSFTHQAEFAGFYAAEHQGYYSEEGLQVSFVEGGPQIDYISPVLNGDAQFGVAQPSDVILARADGKPVGSIAALYRRNPIVFIALADSGITRPQDFVGKKIRSTFSSDVILQAMMSHVGISQNQFQVEYHPSIVSQFASGEVPIWSAFVNGLALEVQAAGYKINTIFPDDYGIHFYGDVLITTDEMISKNPDLVLKFTRATLKGWTYSVEHPEAAGAFVQIYNPEADQELEAAKIAASIPLINTGQDFIGWMTLDKWTGIKETLQEQGVLTASLDVRDVYTLQFLKELYGK
jgi:NitT/TauT family transport system substrate-binding protein